MAMVGLIPHIPHVTILEQPTSNPYRFRYECEGRSIGSIPGASSTPDRKTHPTIQIVGFPGKAVVVVSCVTTQPPFRPHPYKLVGKGDKYSFKHGVCTLETSSPVVEFSQLGIQCVKKKEIESLLWYRRHYRVDPFRTGFAHRNSIDLYTVRLCFQVFLEDDTGKFTVALEPVVSDPVTDRKAMPSPHIVKMSPCSSYADGSGADVILLCEKFVKEDITVRLFQEENGRVLWEDFVRVCPSQVHKQTAVWFAPPPYRSLDIAAPVQVFVQLRRPSDGTASEALPFRYLPLERAGEPQRKKMRVEADERSQEGLCSSFSSDCVRKFLNLDDQQIELKPLELNSGDLSGASLSESFSRNLSLTDVSGDVGVDPVG